MEGVESAGWRWIFLKIFGRMLGRYSSPGGWVVIKLESASVILSGSKNNYL